MPHELSFGGGGSLRRDSNGDHYLAPQWEQTPAGVGIAAHSYPYLYMVNKPITFGTIKFKKRPNSEDLTEPIAIKGVGSDSAWFGPADMFVNDGLANPAGPLQAKQGEFLETPKAFSATTKYDPEYSVDWMFSTDGKPFDDPEKEWKSAGTTSHILYACLADPVSFPGLLYRTVVHLACSNGNTPSPYLAAKNSFDLLEGGNFKGWSGDATSDAWNRALFYYEPGTSSGQNKSNISDLLKEGTGQCLAWVNLYRAACTINGQESSRVRLRVIYSSNDSLMPLFCIAKWDIPATGTSPNPLFPYEFTYTSGDPLEVNAPYGDLKNLTKIRGQGSDDPSIKSFSNHSIVKIVPSGGGTEVLADPSYGVIYDSIQDLPFVCAGGVMPPPNQDPDNKMVQKRSGTGVFSVVESWD